jgi:dTDP-4-dehydrorhamnose reductase
MTGLELWGGVECTIARVGDEYRHQLEETGHWRRNDDVDLIASLGIRTLRYPVLWEAHAPEAGRRPDFSWRRCASARSR